MASFFDPFGLFDSGGGGSSSSVTSTVNLNVNGLDDMKSTLELKPVEIKPLEVRPFTFNENLDIKPIEVKPLAFNETLDVKPLEIKPLTLNENIDLRPVTVNETFDLRPVAVDACQTLRLAPLPETRICQPYRHHVGYTMFGMEWMGVTYEGESRQIVESPHRPQVVDRQGHVTRPARRGHATPTEIAGSRGIRVRVLSSDDE